MDILSQTLEKVLAQQPFRFTLSGKRNKALNFERCVITQKQGGWQAEKFTKTQSFHNSIKEGDLKNELEKLLCEEFVQLVAFSSSCEQSIKHSTKGTVLYNKKQKLASVQEQEQSTHNRKKKYLLAEGVVVPPLVDMGIFTAEGRVVAAMQHKYRQINRFLELIDDVIKKEDVTHLNILDFGCGKSYLTFILYYYLVEIRGITADITGLDLKEDVVASCNKTAQKYGYSGLIFKVGDINGYSHSGKVDMLITLHACNTATDYALASAVKWGARLIFSVPCCQHEINGQIKSEPLAILTRYGIVQERVSALFTDAIRANMLKTCGYKAQLLEFVDFEDTPKNILIRAVKSDIPLKEKQKAFAEVQNLVKEFNLAPTLLQLLNEELSGF